VKPDYAISDVVPHSGVMSLLDELIEYDADSLTARVAITQHSCFAEARGVPSWIGIEYMAQTIAAHAGIGDRNSGNAISIGLLVGTRRYSCSRPFFPLGSELLIHVVRELQGDNGLGTFRCTITAEGIEAQANLNVFQPDDVDAYLHNEKNKG